MKRLARAMRAVSRLFRTERRRVVERYPFVVSEGRITIKGPGAIKP